MRLVGRTYGDAPQNSADPGLTIWNGGWDGQIRPQLGRPGDGGAALSEENEGGQAPFAVPFFGGRVVH